MPAAAIPGRGLLVSYWTLGLRLSIYRLDSETPEGFARLIGGGLSRPHETPETRAAAKTLPSPGLPDPLAHLVCKFWLGEPPRRRRAAPATE